MIEQIVLVDEDGNPTGVAPKLASHNENTPLHLAFSCYIFDKKGHFLVTQRAMVKKVWPGVWTNSVCGHPGPGESVEDAIKRRCEYELGITELLNLQLLIPDYRYKTPPFRGIIENEFCPIYIATTIQQPKPNPDEVEAYKWLSWSQTIKEIKSNPSTYSYWFKDQIPRIDHLAEFTRLSHPYKYLT